MCLKKWNAWIRKSPLVNGLPIPPPSGQKSIKLSELKQVHWLLAEDKLGKILLHLNKFSVCMVQALLKSHLEAVWESLWQHMKIHPFKIIMGWHCIMWFIFLCLFLCFKAMLFFSCHTRNYLLRSSAKSKNFLVFNGRAAPAWSWTLSKGRVCCQTIYLMSWIWRSGLGRVPKLHRIILNFIYWLTLAFGALPFTTWEEGLINWSTTFHCGFPGLAEKQR